MNENTPRQRKIRAFRHEFEMWAMALGLDVGRNEAGYYDDTGLGADAWRVAFMAADALGVFG